MSADLSTSEHIIGQLPEGRTWVKKGEHNLRNDTFSARPNKRREQRFFANVSTSSRKRI